MCSFRSITGFTMTSVSGLAHQVRIWSAVTIRCWFSTRASSTDPLLPVIAVSERCTCSTT